MSRVPAASTRTRGRAAVALAAAALALTPLVSACGTTQAGAAAVVGDRRITVDELQTATADIRKLVQDPTQITQQLVLGWLIAEPEAVAVAGTQGKGVSAQDAQNVFQQQGFKGAGGSGKPSDAAVTAVQAALALQNLAGQNAEPQAAQKAVDDILGRLKADRVKVNPRYGTFDYRWDAQTQTFTLSPRSVNWLSPSKPASGAGAPSAEPSPSGS